MVSPQRRDRQVPPAKSFFADHHPAVDPGVLSHPAFLWARVAWADKQTQVADLLADRNRLRPWEGDGPMATIHRQSLDRLPDDLLSRAHHQLGPLDYLFDRDTGEGLDGWDYLKAQQGDAVWIGYKLADTITPDQREDLARRISATVHGWIEAEEVDLHRPAADQEMICIDGFDDPATISVEDVHAWSYGDFFREPLFHPGVDRYCGPRLTFPQVFNRFDDEFSVALALRECEYTPAEVANAVDDYQQARPEASDVFRRGLQDVLDAFNRVATWILFDGHLIPADHWPCATEATLIGADWPVEVAFRDTNKIGQTKVDFRSYGKHFSDRIDLSNAEKREGCIKRLGSTWGVSVSCLVWLLQVLTDGPRVSPEPTDKPQNDQVESDKLVEFHRITCADLDATQYDLEYLVDWTLLRGQPCILAGPKKSLKTSILIDLGISLALGGHFLGRLPAPHAVRVAMMSGESGMPVIQETARRIANTAGYALGDIGNLIFSESLPWLPSQTHLDALVRFITDDELEVLILDPAYLCMPGQDAGNLFVQGALLRGLNEVTSQTGATVILAHHLKKLVQNPLDPPELEHIAWSGFQEWARQWLLIGRRELYAPGSGSHKLWLSIGGSAGHSALWAVDIFEGVVGGLNPRCWEVTMMKPDEAWQAAANQREAVKEAKDQAKAERDKEKVLRALAKYPDGETKNTLKAAANMSGGQFDVILDAFLDEGVVVPAEVVKGHGARHYPGYKLANDPQ